MDAGYYDGGGDTSGIGGGPDLTASSDSSGIGGGGPQDFSSQDQGTNTFNAPGDITGMGFGGIGQGPGGPPGGFGGGYYPSSGGGGGAGGFLDTGGVGGPGGSIYGLGGAGGFGGLGFGTDLGSLAQNAGFGFGPSAGNPAGWGPSPEFVNTGPDAAPVQSALQLTDPGALTQGANDPNAAQSGAPGGTGSGPQQSIMDQILSVLGGINPISTAAAAPAVPGTAGQPGLPSTPVTPGGANVGWADPNLSAAPPSGYLSGAGSNFPGMFAGGGTLPSGLGGTASGAPAWPGAITGPPSGFLGDTGSGIPGMFAGGGLVPGSTGAPLSAQGAGGVASGAPADQSTNFAGQFAPAEGMPGAVSPLAAFSGTQFGPTPLSVFANQFAPAESMPSAVSPLAAFTGTPIGQGVSQQANVPSIIGPTDTSANLALQGVDSAPPSPPIGVLGGPPGGAFDPFVQNAPPGQFGAPQVPGTTADTETPPAPDSPAAIAQQSPQSGVQAVPSLPSDTSQIPLPIADPRTQVPLPTADPRGPAFTPQSGVQAVPSLPRPSQVGDVPLPRAAPGQAAGPPAAPGGGGGPAPQAPSRGGRFGDIDSTAGSPDEIIVPKAPAGSPHDVIFPPDGGWQGKPLSREVSDTSRGGFERGQQRTIGQQIFGRGGMVSSLFGGGQLGDTVGSLMAQLGIPAALIFAATRGGGARLPMVGGARAMSGAGQVGGFSPQFSRNLFPGPGIPALVGLGLGGAALGQSLVNPPQNQTGAGQGGGPPSGVGAPPQQPSPPTLRSPTTTNLVARPADLAGGATEGATRARPTPFGAASAPQGTIPGATAAPGMLNPITQPGGGTQAENFITQRGGHTAGAGAPQLNPEFASRVQRAAQAYENETGQRATFGETGRSREQQAKYYADFRSGRGGLAAAPGSSRHERGMAIDINEPRFQAWMHRNAYRFGLEGLRDPRDPDHFQMADPVLAGIRQRQASMAQ